MGLLFSKTVIAALVGLAFVGTGAKLWRNPPPFASAISQLQTQISADSSKAVVFIETFVNIEKPQILKEPHSLLALSEQDLPSQLESLMAAGQRCDLPEVKKSLSHSSAQKKLALWFLAECNQDALSPTYFSTPPYITPLGGSFVFWHLTHAKKPGDASAFLKTNHTFLHLLEHWQPEVITHINPPALVDEVGISPQSLSAILKTNPLVNLNKYVLSAVPGYKGYRATVREDFMAELSSLGYTMSEKKFGGCGTDLNHSDLCFKGISLKLYNLSALSLLVTGFFAIFIALGVALRKRWGASRKKQLDQEMVMQTLAHELRHPATSLRLSLEVFRNRFDELPHEAKDEFLRMTSQLQKMNRIMKLTQGQEIVVAVRGDLAIADLINEAVRDYADRVQTESEKWDLRIKADPLWFVVCLQNLIKNALVHGKPPILIGTTIETNGTVRIFVQDQGESPHLNFAQMTTPFAKPASLNGMGLGLSLVDRVMKRMSGRLEFASNPKRFSLIFPLDSSVDKKVGNL